MHASLTSDVHCKACAVWLIKSSSPGCLHIKRLLRVGLLQLEPCELACLLAAGLHRRCNGARISQDSLWHSAVQGALWGGGVGRGVGDISPGLSGSCARHSPGALHALLWLTMCTLVHFSACST